jgi:hypothetical protein
VSTFALIAFFIVICFFLSFLCLDLGTVFSGANAELSRSRRGLGADEAREQRILHRHRKQKGRRLSAQVKS